MELYMENINPLKEEERFLNIGIFHGNLPMFVQYFVELYWINWGKRRATSRTHTFPGVKRRSKSTLGTFPSHVGLGGVTPGGSWCKCKQPGSFSVVIHSHLLISWITILYIKKNIKNINDGIAPSKMGGINPQKMGGANGIAIPTSK